MCYFVGFKTINFWLFFSLVELLRTINLSCRSSCIVTPRFTVGTQRLKVICRVKIYWTKITFLLIWRSK
jgi:hypothetical protein